jgi:hypothetical protein
MVTLTLRVDKSQPTVRLMFHQGEIDTVGLETTLAEMPHGTYVQAECEYVAGIGLRATTVLAVTSHSQPSPKTSIRALVEKREYERALQELEAMGDARVVADPSLLIARASARIGQADQLGAAADLRQLLTLPGVTSLDARDVFDRFSTTFGSEAAEPLAKEFILWVEAKKPLRAVSYLSSIPPAMWPLELLLSALEETIEANPPDRTRVRQLLEVARSTAPQDPRVLSLWSQAASKGLTMGRLTDAT